MKINILNINKKLLQELVIKNLSINIIKGINKYKTYKKYTVIWDLNLIFQTN